MRRILAFLVILASPAGGQDDSLPYNNAVGSVAWLNCLDRDWEESAASGVVVGDGLILTAHHVVEGDAVIWAHGPERLDGAVINTPAHYRARNNSSMRCVVVASDPGRDLALLRVKFGEKRGRPMALAARSPSPGEAVFAIGNGPDVLFRYSGGNVKAVYPCKAQFPGHDVVARMVEHTVPINVGDSGGPLVNGRGELVGINSYIETDKNQVHKAIDISEVRAFLAGHEAANKKKGFW